MVAAVSTAAGRKPVVLGKPSKFMFDIVKERHPGILAERTLMIGDRWDEGWFKLNCLIISFSIKLLVF